jgi:hypothetical protein
MLEDRNENDSVKRKITIEIESVRRTYRAKPLIVSMLVQLLVDSRNQSIHWSSIERRKKYSNCVVSQFRWSLLSALSTFARAPLHARRHFHAKAQSRNEIPQLKRLRFKHSLTSDSYHALPKEGLFTRASNRRLFLSANSVSQYSWFA